MEAVEKALADKKEKPSFELWGKHAAETNRAEVRTPARLVLNPWKGNSSDAPAKDRQASLFRTARPRDEVLDWKKMESEIDAKKDSSSSRPTSARTARSKSRNPFGDANPREFLLQEQHPNVQRERRRRWSRRRHWSRDPHVLDSDLLEVELLQLLRLYGKDHDEHINKVVATLQAKRGFGELNPSFHDIDQVYSSGIHELQPKEH